MKKCIECEETFFGIGNCPYCGSNDTIELEELRFYSKEAYTEAILGAYSKEL